MMKLLSFHTTRVKTTPTKLYLSILTALIILLAACSPAPETGTLTFTANGEDFVRQGFTSKDGWAINFDHVYVTLSDVAAYQTDPPFTAESLTIESDTSVELADTMTVDLAEGDDTADPIVVGTVTDAPVGHFNALAFSLTSADVPAIELVGTAEKDDESIEFTIRIEEPYTYACGEYVGDARKGILTAEGTADVEMTFHFDHIFGDAEAAADDHINVGAVGFAPFAALADNGTVDIGMDGIANGFAPEDYQLLIDTLPSLGHVGEGHCHESRLDS